MPERKRIIFSLLISLIAWSVFTWPLPENISTAIPFSAQMKDKDYISSMEPGDHLQYLYYLILWKDMITGSSPLYFNLYEFNTGNDLARYEPDSYYAPFSFLFAAVALVGSYALAWNLMGLITLWLSYWITWKLARRYTEYECIAAAAALITFALPVRWVNLLGGSPMGPAMLWPPLVMYGLDMAVRDLRIRGGFIAGISLMFALWTDLHVFFFSTLIVPAWCVVAFIKKEQFEWRRWASYWKMALVLLPVPFFLGLAIGIRHFQQQGGHLVAESIRDWREAALFSPHAIGLLHRADEISAHIYLGYGIAALAAMGLLALVIGILFFRTKLIKPVDLLLFAVLSMALGGTILLALGAHGPMGGKVFDLSRKYMPFYSMIRQSGKIYCLMPPMLAVMAVTVHRLYSVLPGRKISSAICLVLIGWSLAAGYQRVGAGLTRIETKQGAYEAVTRDAKTNNLRNGAIVVPLWPGDTHFTSVYQLYSLANQIRMVNGYDPSVGSEYKTEIFLPFSSINQGELDDWQLDDLQTRGIHYILLHENLFPEKVSPFPVSFTILNLLNNPRIEFLAQDKLVWAFRITEKPAEHPELKPDWTAVFPARRFEAEFYSQDRYVQDHDDTAGNHAFVSYDSTNGFVSIPSFPVTKTPDLAWMIRARGDGVMRVVSGSENQSPVDVWVTGKEWTWYRVPVVQTQEMAECGLQIDSSSGRFDIDTTLLAVGSLKSLAAGETIHIGAARFFHGGYSDFDNETVTLEKNNDPIGIQLFGPKLPLDAGTYEVEMTFKSGAAPGTRLGIINLEQDDLTGRGVPVDVIAGQPARGVVDRPDNLPFNIVYIFHAGGDISIEQVEITRIK